MSQFNIRVEIPSAVTALKLLEIEDVVTGIVNTQFTGLVINETFTVETVELMLCWEEKPETKGIVKKVKLAIADLV